SGSTFLFCARVLRARFYSLSEHAFPHRPPCSSQQTFLTSHTLQIENPGREILSLAERSSTQPTPSNHGPITDTELEDPAPVVHDISDSDTRHKIGGTGARVPRNR
ncbi:unnamed protein product, partial [Ectocarpus sp. 12 AP-2014]